MKFIKDYFQSLIILLLLIIIFSGRCSKPVIIEKPVIKRDTVWIKHDSIVYTKPQVIHTIPPPPETINHYTPDTNYYELKKQYISLLVAYLNKNIEWDSLKIDSIGYVYVTDTVTKNLIAGRSYRYNLTYPQVTTTIITPPLRRNQVYIGGALQGSFAYPFNQISAGFLLKNKKDQIFGAYTGVNKDGEMQFGLQSYWKISFR